MGKARLNREWRAVAAVTLLSAWPAFASDIGSEAAVPVHLADGEELELSLGALVAHGQRLFEARWTREDGGGRPWSKGSGEPLADLSAPLVFPRNFNRVSAPDANACVACHNVPRNGAAGDFAHNAVVLGQRFDFATFDGADTTLTRGMMNEGGAPATLQTIGNPRNPPSLFGAGYIELLARQMTADLQRQRDALAPGSAAPLWTKGVYFGVLARGTDGSWDTSAVEGLPSPSLAVGEAGPSLVIRPFMQAGVMVSLREFVNGAFNQHFGIQSAERFGAGADPDGDEHVDEMTRGDVTAVTLFIAQLGAPGRVIPRDREIEAAIALGERRFGEIGCADCHVPALPLDNRGWVFSEPGPFNPPGNLSHGDVPAREVNLASSRLDPPRLKPGADGILWVPAFTDLKLHDITRGPDDPNREALDMHAPPGSPGFFAGNARFLTRKLWGIADESPFFHHGLYMTLREAVEAHGGEADYAYQAWRSLPGGERDAIIEFLKSHRILPEGTPARIVDERGRPRRGLTPPSR